MMEPKELRLDNLILRNGDIAWIVAIRPNGFDAAVKNKDILSVDQGAQYDGIPLTAEWLERMGFQLAEKLWEPSVGDAYGDLYYKRISIIKQERTGGFHLLLDGGPYEHEYGFPGIRVTTVHQLQNLYFALTGEELPYDISALTRSGDTQETAGGIAPGKLPGVDRSRD